MTTEISGERKRVVILGATGSIGESALKVARDIPERMEIVGLAANSNAEKLAAAANETRAQSVCLVDETKIDALQRALAYKPRIFAGQKGLREIACLTNAEMVLVAIVGTGGLRPALAAIEAGKDLAVASKEILVMAGEIVMREARNNGVNVLPVDSEHNAIFQCLEGKSSLDIRRIILTASGGPFRETPRKDFNSIIPEQALKHPTWNMGPKITIDSATLFNKGLEMIEAHWLFERRDEARRSGDTPAEHCSFDGRVRRRVHARAIELFEHVFPNPIRRDLAGSRSEYFATTRFLEIVQVGIFDATLRRFSRTEPGTPGGRDRWHIARRHERRKRSSGRWFFGAASAFSGYLADC